MSVLVVDPRNPATVYAGSDTGGGVVKTIDGGRTWRVVSTGLVGMGVDALAIDPQAPSTLYAATNLGLSKSTNGGKSWRSASAGFPAGVRVQALAIDAHAPATLYAATRRSVVGARTGVFRSTDGGAHWRPFTRGLGPPEVNALAISPAGLTLYAAPVGGGVVSYTF